jgi:prevent-host-death family protein
MATKKKTIYNVHEAKTNLSRLLQQVADGEEVIIAKDGDPVARLVPMPKQSGVRQLGFAQGQVWMSDDFNETPEEFKEYVEDG